MMRDWLKEHPEVRTIRVAAADLGDLLLPNTQFESV